MERRWLAVAVLGLDGAALHDILGGEPDVRLEWASLAGSLTAFGLLLWRARLLRSRRSSRSCRCAASR